MPSAPFRPGNGLTSRRSKTTASLPPPPTGTLSATNPYSVLLLYPDCVGNYGQETYYAFVEAADPVAAVAVAQRQAADAQSIDIDDPADFAPLLVTAGHHASEPLFNK